MDNKLRAVFLYKLSEKNRQLESDHIIKANAPNAKDLCTGKLNFESAMSEVQGNKSSNINSINSALNRNIEKTPVNKSVREASVDLGEAYILNTAMIKLLNHYYKQDKSVIDGYRPQ